NLDAAVAASLIVGNVAMATLCFWGIIANFNVASVMIPRVPSEPVKREFKLYPAEVFRGRFLVLMIDPSGRTTVKLTTQSFIVPYRVALVPLQFVEIIPPIRAVGLGSRGRKRPECFIFSLRSTHRTPD